MSEIEQLKQEIAELRNATAAQSEVLEKQVESIAGLQEEIAGAQTKFGPPAGSCFTLPGNRPADTPGQIKAYLNKMKLENRTLPAGLSSFLNPYELEAGDILLISPISDKTRSKIKYTQTYETQFNILRDEYGLSEAEAEKHSIYTHVSISRRGHELFESVPSEGITNGSFWKFMNDEEYLITVRRLKQYEKDDRAQLVFSIAPIFGNDYGILDLGALKAKSENIGWLRDIFAVFGDDEDYICSALFAAVCDKEFIDLQINNTPLQQVTPAHLSYSPAMETIDVSRVKMPPNFLKGF